MIVDDNDMMRSILRGMLRGETYDVVGEARNGVQAVEMADRLKPDIVCLDVMMPEKNGIEALIEIKAASLNFPDLLIVQNKYQMKPELPFVPGSEYAGGYVWVYSQTNKPTAPIDASHGVGAPAEYGGFTGAVVNTVTKSGGNTFSGSVRATFTNDSWRAYNAYRDPTTGANPQEGTFVDKTVPTYEATFGGKPEVGHWTFSTNGIATAGMFGIPTLGFGPGHEKFAHFPDEQIEIEHLVKAAAFYAGFVEAFAGR